MGPGGVLTGCLRSSRHQIQHENVPEIRAGPCGTDFLARLLIGRPLAASGERSFFAHRRRRLGPESPLPCVTWSRSLTNNFELVEGGPSPRRPAQVDRSCSPLSADHAVDTRSPIAICLLAGALDRVRWVVPKAECAFHAS